MILRSVYNARNFLFVCAIQHLVNNITALYPDANIWLVGHSLGGALASLLGTTFGLPAVAFEAPGERLAATRLHLPLPPASAAANSPGYFGSAPVTHVYHNADPIPQGACTGFGSPCVAAGYALETRCHIGKSIVYDTVGKLGWRVDVRTHPIRTVILEVIEREMQDGWEEDCDGFLRAVPAAKVEEDCIVSELVICTQHSINSSFSRIVSSGSLETSRRMYYHHDTSAV